MNKPYEFHAAINIVEFCELKKRNTGRFIDSATKFMQDQDNNIAPRLPDLNGLSDQIDSIVDNVLAFMKTDDFNKLSSFRVYSAMGPKEEELPELAIVRNPGSKWNVVKEKMLGYDTRQIAKFRAA